MRDVFEFRERLIDEYKSFSGSFTKIAAPDIRAEVERQYALGRYWPEPLVQINPNFEQAETVQQLVQMGILHNDCARIFRPCRRAGRGLPRRGLPRAQKQGAARIRRGYRTQRLVLAAWDALESLK